MTSIVLELQRDALDGRTSVEDLLRKGLVVARKLGVSEIQTWLEHELDGYPPGAPIPGYRTIHGEVKCFNPVRGLIPLMIADPEYKERLSSRQIMQAVPELERLAGRHGVRQDGVLQMEFQPEIERLIMEGMEYPMQPTLVVQEISLHGILNKVRNAVLDWALGLETQGILGEGLSFTEGEKEAAAASSGNINNFYGPVGTTNIQQDVETASQVTNVGAVNREGVAAFVKELIATVPSLNLTPEQQAEVGADAETIKVQLASPKPKPGIIRESLRSVRTVLEGAAGGAGAALLVKLAALLAQ